MKAPASPLADAGADAIVAQGGGGECHIAAGEGLAEAQDIGFNTGVLQCKQLAGAAEAGGDFIEDQQNIEGIAQRKCTRYSAE